MFLGRQKSINLVNKWSQDEKWYLVFLLVPSTWGGLAGRFSKVVINQAGRRSRPLRPTDRRMETVCTANKGNILHTFPCQARRKDALNRQRDEHDLEVEGCAGKMWVDF